MGEEGCQADFHDCDKMAENWTSRRMVCSGLSEVSVLGWLAPWLLGLWRSSDIMMESTLKESCSHNSNQEAERGGGRRQMFPVKHSSGPLPPTLSHNATRVEPSMD